MGGDFTYQQAEMYFANMDKLIRYLHFVKALVSFRAKTCRYYVYTVYTKSIQEEKEGKDLTIVTIIIECLVLVSKMHRGH